MIISIVRFIIPILTGTAFGAYFGRYGLCCDGSCPLTSPWWRGALYGAGVGLLLSLFARAP
jgi:hypothetical protein